MTELESLLKIHLKLNEIINEEASVVWTVRKSSLGGRGLFATRDIKVNEIVLIDAPLILGPRAASTTPVSCAVCYSRHNNNNNNKDYTHQSCAKGCGIKICSKACEQSTIHRKECDLILKWNCGKPLGENSIHKSLTPIRSLFLNDDQKRLLQRLKAHTGKQHGFEVDILKYALKLQMNDEEEALMRLTCLVLDANAFEVVVGDDYTHCASSLRGLYPLSGLMNHDCSPNTMHLFDPKQRMIVKACRDICQGEEITHSYARLLWGTLARRPHLMRTKHFYCCCKRCEDPTEFGTYLSAVLCKNCQGCVVPTISSRVNVIWKCENCDKEMDAEVAGSIVTILASRINNFETENVANALMFLQNVLIKYAPPFNQVALDLKYKLIYIIGHRSGFLWNELTDQLLSQKESICLELIDVIERLQLGQCKMKGHILFELFCCYREKQRRLELNDKGDKDYNKADFNKLLKESQEILYGDVSPTPQ